MLHSGATCSTAASQQLIILWFYDQSCHDFRFFYLTIKVTENIHDGYVVSIFMKTLGENNTQSNYIKQEWAFRLLY